MEPDDGLTAAERKRRRDLEYNEEDTGVTSIQKEERIAQVDLANFGVPAGGKVWLARLPNFLSLNSVPFDELMWDPEDAEDAPEGESQEAGAAKPTLPDENIIRWKWSTDEHGQVVSWASRVVLPLLLRADALLSARRRSPTLASYAGPTAPFPSSSAQSCSTSPPPSTTLPTSPPALPSPRTPPTFSPASTKPADTA